PPSGVPAPVDGSLGSPMGVAGLRLTVLSAMLDAQPPAAVELRAGDRLVVVQGLYQAGGATPAVAAPDDWVVTDDAGTVYGAVQDGLSGAVGEGWMGPSGTARGVLGFAVPRASQGLVLHFDADSGDDAAQVPLG